MAVAESETYVGSAIRRKEDDALLRGGGTFVDNLTLPGTLAMFVVRSPYPHEQCHRSVLSSAIPRVPARFRVHAGLFGLSAAILGP